jgi:RNA polymerase-binding protein DksA
LAADRLNTTERVAALSRDFDRLVASTETTATDDEHDPEGQTIAFERSQLTALLDQARQHLDDVDRALEQLRNGTYGVCQRCGEPIGADRLEARPVATTCIRCAQLS